MPQRLNSIVVINCLWMTALSWENWVKRYTDKGFRVIAKSWPGMDIDINELRRNPASIATLGITEIVDHYENILRGLASAPIIIGHSFGGLMPQIPLDLGPGPARDPRPPPPAQSTPFLTLAPP